MRALAITSLLLLALSACDTDPAETPCAGEGVICTYAGTGRAGLGTDGVDRTKVQLYLPQDLTFGPDGRPYILDWNNHRIRVVDAEGKVATLIGTGELGDAPDGPALQTRLNHPTHVAFSPTGKLILSAWHNSKVMEMDLQTGMIESICGTGGRSFGGEGGDPKTAVLDLPVATAFDSQGRLYIMDQGNQRIRRIENDALVTVVGPVGAWEPPGYVKVCEPDDGDPNTAPDCRWCLEEEASDPDCKGSAAKPQGFSGDGGDGTLAFMYQPFSQSAPPAGRMEMGPNDVLYWTDTGNHRIRVLNPDGTVETVVGDGPDSWDPTYPGAYAGDGGPALQASLKEPRDVAVAPDGTLFIADTGNSCVRMVDTDGIITTVAGICGEQGYDGDGGDPTATRLNRPYGVAVSPDGDLYIADTHNHRIRVVHLATAGGTP